MATVPTNISERIFNISNWHGVNEAPEGEARLRLGEAAVMKNFCVTSGGALKKRPGSRNVAGLLNKYAARVREGEAKLLMTDVALSREYMMYPRMDADDTGIVRPAGSPTGVNGDNAGTHQGYIYEKDGVCWWLDRCEREGNGRGEAISGGSAVPGARAVIGTGTYRAFWTKHEYIGTEYVDTWTQATVRQDGGGLKVGVQGQTNRQKAPEKTEVGWATQDVGGYFLQNGALWKYYGAEVTAVRPAYTWGKFRCTLVNRLKTYYEEGPWAYDYTEIWSGDGNGYGAFSDYIFDPDNGTFSFAGTSKTLFGGQSGVIYGGWGGGNISKIVFTAISATTSRLEHYHSTIQGPFTHTVIEYTPGESLGSVDAMEGELPDQARGYQYVDTFTSGEELVYTVMRYGEDYYCYLDMFNGPSGHEIDYRFYGLPMEVTADLYRWYFKETYATTDIVEDTQVRGIWSGRVGSRDVICAICGGTLWELKLSEEGVWSKVAAGKMDTSQDIQMFGFDEKLYLLGGEKYMVWDGERLSEVEGYRPLVAVAVAPAGGGTLLENVNRLSTGRRCWFSPDGEGKVFKLPEENIASLDWVRDRRTGQELGYGPDLEAGTITFGSAPERGVNTIEVAWSVKTDSRAQVAAMRYAEIYNGAQDTRVFLYGDGSNKAIYSGLDYDGRARADYFPDLYEVAVGDANTPITAMIRHYNKLMAFKPDSAWSIGYDTITLIDGTVTAGFYVTPVNRSIGNCAWGQAQLVQNRPRTLDGRSVIEWKATSTGGITGDQRNAERVSQRVDATIRRFDLTKARTFYDKFSHEYFVIGEDGTAVVQNMDVDAWYVYTNLQVTCMINYRDELYYGTRDGYLRHFSDRYFSDNGEAIEARWESGAMSFSEDFRRKYSAMVWIGIKPEDNGYLEVTAQTDRKSDFAVYDVESVKAGAVPEMERIKLKAKKFTYYKLILGNNTADKTCTVVSADMRVRGTGYVR